MINRLLLIFLGLFFCNLCYSQVTQDVKGASDIEFVGRYPGSYISAYQTSEFDSTIIPLTLNSSADIDNFKKLTAEGERRIAIYDVAMNVEPNTLKIFRSIVAELLKAGVEPYVNCSATINGCGDTLIRQIYTKNEMEKYFSYKFKEFVNLFIGDFHIFSGHLDKDGATYYLKVVVAKSKYASFPQYSIDVTKVASLKTKAMDLTREQMGTDMEKAGKVVLSGLYFEHDSTDLTVQSAVALKVIAAYLKDHPKERFLVVGHTDAQGSYQYNLNLSQARAASVERALISEYGIPKTAIKSVGASFIAPMSSNEDASGRAQNRRVELVKVEQF